MKKATSLILIISFLLFAMPVSAASSSTDWKTAYKNQILKYTSSENFGQDTQITIVDLDRDGVPELFAGVPYRTVNHVDLAFTFKNGKLQALKYKGPGLGAESPIGFKIGMEALRAENLKVYKEKSSGKVVIIGEDGAGGAPSWTSELYSIRLKGTQLTAEKISAYHAEYGDHTDIQENFFFGGKKISQSVYDKKHKEYYSKLTEIPKQSTGLSGLELIRAKEDGSSYASKVNSLLKITASSKPASFNMGSDIYAKKSLSEKKKLLSFLGNFPEEVTFDATRYTGDQLVKIVSDNTNIYGIGPLKKLTEKKTITKKVTKSGSTYDWTFDVLSKKAVNQYIYDLFGLTPTKVSNYYFAKGSYHFPHWEAGGGVIDSPQIDQMYALGQGLYYIELTRYDVDMEEYDYDKWRSFGDFRHQPMTSWSQAVKSNITVEKKGTWHAIIKERSVGGKKVLNLVKIQKGKLSPSSLQSYLKKLKL